MNQRSHIIFMHVTQQDLPPPARNKICRRQREEKASTQKRNCPHYTCGYFYGHQHEEDHPLFSTCFLLPYLFDDPCTVAGTTDSKHATYDRFFGHVVCRMSMSRTCRRSKILVLGGLQYSTGSARLTAHIQK
jgi:hypothetical protein